MIYVIFTIVMLTAEGVALIHHAKHPDKAQSWDQENLKRTDHGCPTAVFVAPNGNLVQCP